jgi:hypothetical protein
MVAMDFTVLLKHMGTAYEHETEAAESCVYNNGQTAAVGSRNKEN